MNNLNKCAATLIILKFSAPQTRMPDSTAGNMQSARRACQNCEKRGWKLCEPHGPQYCVTASQSKTHRFAKTNSAFIYALGNNTSFSMYLRFPTSYPRKCQCLDTNGSQVGTVVMVYS